VKRFGLLTLLCLVMTPAIFAQAQRTFVSGANGNDANAATNCAVTTPCRNFTAAQGVTNSGGDIVVLDSAGYGSFTITKALNISVPSGVYAGITRSTGGAALVVNAGSSDIVRIKGLLINATVGATTGIQINGGKRVEVWDTQIQGAQVGVEVAGTNVRVFMSNIVVEDAVWAYYVHGSGAKVSTGSANAGVGTLMALSSQVALRWEGGNFANCNIVCLYTNTFYQITSTAGCGNPGIQNLAYTQQTSSPDPAASFDNRSGTDYTPCGLP
jgi:hypothetical protein